MFGIWQIILILIIIFVLCPFPAYFALKKMGYNGWWFLVLGLPFISIISLGIIAYGKWPNANKDGDLVKKIHDPIKDKS